MTERMTAEEYFEKNFYTVDPIAKQSIMRAYNDGCAERDQWIERCQKLQRIPSVAKLLEEKAALQQDNERLSRQYQQAQDSEDDYRAKLQREIEQNMKLFRENETLKEALAATQVHSGKDE